MCCHSYGHCLLSKMTAGFFLWCHCNHPINCGWSKETKLIRAAKAFFASIFMPIMFLHSCSLFQTVPNVSDEWWSELWIQSVSVQTRVVICEICGPKAWNGRQTSEIWSQPLSSDSCESSMTKCFHSKVKETYLIFKTLTNYFSLNSLQVLYKRHAGVLAAKTFWRTKS